MQRQWYTCFLLASLLIFGLFTGGKQIYDVWQRPWEIRGELPEIEEVGKHPETLPEEEKNQYHPSEIGKNEQQLEQESETEDNIQQPEIVENDRTETEEEKEEIRNPADLFKDNFNDVLFIGDSRTTGLYEYGQMEGAEAFADNGMSVFNLWKKELSFSEGEKRNLEQVLEKKQYRAIYFMLGINELGYSREQVVAKYRQSVEKIQKMQPDAYMILGANLHVTEERTKTDAIFNNVNINELNEEIRNIAEQLQCDYMDVNVLFDDENGSLSEEYSVDGSHVLGKYYRDWAIWIQNGGN